MHLKAAEYTMTVIAIWNKACISSLTHKLKPNIETGSSISSQTPGHYILKNNPIYPTPPLRQDMTQGQFLSGV